MRIGSFTLKLLRPLKNFFRRLLELTSKPLERLFPVDSRHYRLKRGLTIALTILAVVGLTSLIGFVRTQSITYHYAGESCVTMPLLFPTVVRTADEQPYKVSPRTSVSIAGVALYSHRTCAQMTEPTRQIQTARLRIVGLGFISKSIRIDTTDPPRASLKTDSRKPISLSGQLKFSLDQSDETFDYILKVAGINAHSTCRKQTDQLACELAPLKLAQTTAYSFHLERQFHGQIVNQAAVSKLTTVQAVTVAGSSIGAAQIVYDQPKSLTIKLNRAVSSAEAISLVRVTGDKREPLSVRNEVKEAELIITFDKPLPRMADLELTVGRVVAADEGYLDTPFVLPFKTSGGPKLVSSSVAGSRVAPGSAVTLQFDSELAPNQDLSAFIKLEAGGKQLPIGLSANKRSASFRLPAMAPCTLFVTRIMDGLQNIHGVTGGSAWQSQSRLLCQTITSIGTSVQGRPITAYKFGSGPSHMIFVGGTHGDERSSTTNLQRWVDHLESNPGIVPAHRSVTVIPILNPDGYAANKRTNANNVDLNRNFPTNNWKQSVVMPDKSTNPSGGGSSALSEPESRALASYTTSLRPRLVLTYHAKGGVVIPNDSGDSVGLARTYDKNSNLYFQANGNTANIFEYDTTGAYEDWLFDKVGIPALLIEHVNMTGDEFNRNLPAMKIMVGL